MVYTHTTTTMKKEVMNLRGNNRDILEDLERRTGKEKLYNYIIIVKNKLIIAGGAGVHL